MNTEQRIYNSLSKAKENKLQKQKLGAIDDIVKQAGDNLDEQAQQYIQKSSDLSGAIYEFSNFRDNLITKLEQFSNININEVNELLEAYKELKNYTGIDKPAQFSIQDIESQINIANEIINVLERINVNID